MLLLEEAKPGCKVRCVRGDFKVGSLPKLPPEMSEAGYGPQFPHVGKVYTIFEVVAHDERTNGPGLTLMEVRSLLILDWSSPGISFPLHHFELVEPAPPPTGPGLFLLYCVDI